MTGAADARLLRQTTDSFTGTGVDKSWMVLATTDVAESRAQSASLGFEHMEATVTALATDLYPGSQVRASTSSLSQSEGPAGEVSAAAFGPVALSKVDTQTAVTVAASNAMPLAQPEGTPGTSRGVTLRTFNPTSATGVGAKKDVIVGASIGMALLPAGSFSQSDTGDEPHAISSAGQAVASSFSSRYDVTAPNLSGAGLNRP